MFLQKKHYLLQFYNLYKKSANIFLHCIYAIEVQNLK
jgi:hypothetical protein